jgi:hypothetical protein
MEEKTMEEDIKVERPRGSISRDLGELRQEAESGHFCLRCYANAGLRVKIEGTSCPYCGAVWDTVKKI